jgi:DMSO/TMAO reductase YedYZ heme-binding membrane subunit
MTTLIYTINSLLAPLENIVKKYRTYIGYFFIFLAICSTGFLLDPKSIKDSGGLASMTLWIILWMPILARVFGIRLFAQMLPLRRELGILMGVLALVHGFSFIIPNEALMQSGAAVWQDGNPTFIFF